MSTASPEMQPEKNLKTEASPPKRRGRKRKSEVALRQQFEELESVVKVPQEETVSKRGRPRKKVNYYELANPENVDFSVQPQKKSSYSEENEDIPAVKKKKVGEKNNFSSDSPKTLGSEVSSPLNENNVLEQELGISSISKNQEDSEHLESINGKEASNSSKDVGEPLEDAATSLEATTSTPNVKDKRYNYTGETVKMMNKLFTLFANNTEDKVTTESTNNFVDTNNSVSLNSSNNIKVSIKRAYRKSKKSDVKEEEVDDGSGNVTCAVCNSTLDKNLWSHHKQRYHNNLAWRVGDSPLDLNDQSFVMHTLNALYKKKKPLYCDKCREVKKSVVGFLSHRSQCLKSEEQLESVKIACEICGRKMLPVSMSTHMKMLHQNPNEKVKDEAPSKSLNESNKLLPSKRSAARKAMRIIENVTKTDNKEKYFTTNLDLSSQEFAMALLQKELDETQFIECKFRCNCITTNMEDALKHMEECSEKPSQGFVCKKCLLILSKLEDIIYHIEFTHEISVTNDDDDDPNFTEKESSGLPTFLHTAIRRTDRVLFPHAFEWTYRFCEENFSDLLFEDLAFDKSNWPLLSPKQCTKYLPTMNKSCDVARLHVTSFINTQNEDYTFRKYELFESESHDGNKITLFCGGPISSMAWLPTPYTKQDIDQILAVSVLGTPDAKFETYENYRVESAIQFWNFGLIHNKQFSNEEPKLAFILAHNHGPVWHMEWCPSGCYSFSKETNHRMGLLAVAGSDSVVYFYSVPFISQDGLGLYYKPKPAMKLLLQRPGTALLGGIKYYPTKISWSKAASHNYVAVGYTNGFVALFYLESKSVILKYKDEDGIPCLLPSKCFQAHSHAITALSLYHIHGGCRWLMTGSVDRGVSIWDLDNPSYPISNMKRNTVTDGFWFTNWLCYVTAYDEGSTSAYVTTMLKQARDYVYDPNVTLTCSPSTISAVAGSDWLNGVVHGNAVGEIVALFPHQILQIPDQQKVLKPKRMLFGYASMVDKNKTAAERVENDTLRSKTLQNLSKKKVSAGVKLSKIKSDFEYDNLFVNEPVLYDEAEQKYGLVFCDNKMKSYADFPKTTAKQLKALSKTYGNTYPNQYPLSTINKIAWNPNRQASLYYAIGYQAGFVRISWLEFLKGDHQIK